MLKQSVFSVAGRGDTMRAAVDDADEQMNEFIGMDDQAINIIHMTTQSLFVGGMFYHTITICIQVATEAE